VSSIVESLRESGLGGTAVLLACGFSALAAIIGAVVLAIGRRVPPPLIVAIAALPAAIAVLEGTAKRKIGDLSHADPAMRATIIAGQVAEVVSVRVIVGATALAVGVPLLVLAGAGVARGPRSAPSVAIAAFAVLIQPFIALGLAAEYQVPMAMATSMLAIVLGIPVIVAAAAGDPEKSGPEAAITAPFLYALAMGSWWCMLHARGEMMIFGAVAAVDPAQKAALIEAGLSEIRFDPWLGVASILAAALPAIGGLVAGREDPAPRVAWLVLCAPMLSIPVILVLHDPGASLFHQIVGYFGP
jgi:hypothetical protein